MGAPVNQRAAQAYLMTGVPNPAAEAARELDSRLAAEIKARLAAGDASGARERFGELVGRQQRRASRIAFYYLRDAADADEAVQDAFMRVFSHLPSFREELPFEVWFTRILINGCLDRLKARGRRARWFVRVSDARRSDQDAVERAVSPAASPEALMLARERRVRLAAVLERLPERQRTVFVLSHYDGLSTPEIGDVTGLSESTVRVHLFRAIRRLRAILGGEEATRAPREPKKEKSS
jgi:RNA polymerase sigma-70 factor, ECF subfamily